MSTMTRTTAPVRADVERREPRCRVCRDETVRVAVNELLDWHGIPIILSRSKVRRITLTEILRHLAPLNEGSDTKDRITYDSLWVHFQRHYSLAGPGGVPESPDVQGVQEVQGGPAGMTGVGRLSNSPSEARIKYEEFDPSVTFDYTCATGYLG